MESWPSLQFGGGPCIVLDPGLLFVCCRKSYVSLQFLHRLRFGSFFVEGFSFLTPFLIATRCSSSMFWLRVTMSTDHSYHMFSGEEGDRNVATAGSQSSTCSRSGWGPHNGWLWNFIEDVKWLLLSFMNSLKVAWYYQKKVIFEIFDNPKWAVTDYSTPGRAGRSGNGFVSIGCYEQSPGPSCCSSIGSTAGLWHETCWSCKTIVGAANWAIWWTGWLWRCQLDPKIFILKMLGRTTDDFHVRDHVCIQFGYFSNCRDVISAGKCSISMCLLCLPVFTRPAQTTTCSSTSSCSTRHERDVSVKSSKETRSEGQRWWEVCEHVMRPKKKSHLQSCALFGWRDLHSICTQTMISRIHISGTCLFWTLLRFQASIASRNCPSDEYYFTEFGALRCLEAKLYRCST